MAEEVPGLRTELYELFTTHPREAGEGYCQHLGYCAQTFGRCVLIGFGSLTHGFFPFLLQDFASVYAQSLAEDLAARRHRRTQTVDPEWEENNEWTPNGEVREHGVEEPRGEQEEMAAAVGTDVNEEEGEADFELNEGGSIVDLQ